MLAAWMLVGLAVAADPDTGDTAAPAAAELLAPAPPCGADDYRVKSAVVARSVAVGKSGQDLDRVKVSLDIEDTACADAVQRVVWHLGHRVERPNRYGDRARPGHPVELETWGFFPTWAEVETTSAEPVIVNGFVAWKR